MEISFFGYKIELELLILICVIYLILVGHTICGCCSFSSPLLEGMVTKGNDNNYQSYSLGDNSKINTSNWGAPNLTITSGKQLTPGAENIMNRPEQQIPLPEGEMSIFANTDFKPECCPSAYSTGSGCACITTKQNNYLLTRGGNNTPYSEY
uniref:Uncharacterized protein n=1 Tax=viral metagenome TaxID=1070528 RepID=A0A6C0IGW1_9ZZZZ